MIDRLCVVLAGGLLLSACGGPHRLPDGCLATAQSNFIHNGDFAAPIATNERMFLARQGGEWSVSTDTQLEQIGTEGHDEPGCLRFSGRVIGDAKAKRDRVIAPVTIHGDQAIALGATRMRLSFWARSARPDGAASQIFLRCECFGDGPPYKLVPGGFKTYPKWNRGSGPVGPEWQECVIEDVPVAADTVYNIHFLIKDTASVLLIDDMRFTIEATSP